MFLLLLALGCSKSADQPGTRNSELGTQSSAPALKLHWLGKQRLATESNATNFMAIWRLPESAALEAQTLDKLSTAPWRLLQTPTPVSNAPVVLLRPLLDDLVQAESYLEIRGDTNQPGELVFAIRLDSARAALWQSNLPFVLKSLFPSPTPDPRPKTPDPKLQTANPDFRLQTSDYNLQLTRSGNWTLLALSDLRLQTSDSGLLADFQNRIQRDGSPFAARQTNFWIEAGGDVRVLSEAFRFDWKLPPNTPAVSLTVLGEEGRVRTLAQLDFPGPVPIEMEAWNIPTNLVHDPLVGFMAMRGFRPLLKSLTGWEESRWGTPPNQAFFWSQNGPPLHFFAVPSANASNQYRALSEFLLQKVNPLMMSEPKLNGLKYGSFERSGDSLLRWRGIPLLSPNVGIVDAAPNQFIAGGLFPNRLTNRPAPIELLQQLEADSDLVVYDWEATQPNAFGLIQMTQLARFVFGRARLSMTNNAALPWLTTISTNLGPAGTALRLSNSNQMTFSRSSSIGLTGFELHLLVEWLESPAFPGGVFSLATPPAPPLKMQPQTRKP